MTLSAASTTSPARRRPSRPRSISSTTNSSSRTESYNELVVKLDRTNVALTELRRELALAEADHERHVEMLEERIRALYKSGGNDQLLPMLFLADGVEDLYNRIVLISTAGRQRRRAGPGPQGEQGPTRFGAGADRRPEARGAAPSAGRWPMSGSYPGQASSSAKRSWPASIAEIQAVLDEERQRQAEEQERVRQAVLSLANGGQSYQGPLPQTDDPVLDQLLETAFTYMGIPYVWAGDRPSTGFDCSGFTQFVFAQHGV